MSFDRSIGRSPTAPSLDLGAYQPPFAIEDHVQVQDDSGRLLWWNAAPVQNTGAGKLEIMLTVYAAEGRVPSRIRYFGVVGATTDLTFAFKDLPVP